MNIKLRVREEVAKGKFFIEELKAKEKTVIGWFKSEFTKIENVWEKCEHELSYDKEKIEHKAFTTKESALIVANQIKVDSEVIYHEVK
jgi:hypothetical protein